MNYYLSLQHKATYAIRELTESEENTAGQRAEHARRLKTKTDYARLHEVARHAITVSEILGVNAKTLDHILKYHTDFREHSPRESRLDTTLRRTHQRLLLYAHMAYSMHCRCISYRYRMKNEIQRVFNVVSQDDARASVEIAKAIKADSQAMKATSFIALVFLPPTYISAVFTTTFFDYGADSRSWGVSEKMWIYSAFVVPVTVQVFQGSLVIVDGRNSQSRCWEN
ncbi:hypothetical protein B0O99DRAFT_598091 [Bisporella sp. PMI_857]|nr:hypothetical protein B0O99DRAFT_598091 [Bisporella sp. PMI_857]